MTMQELAKRAIQVQDACNPLGLTKSFAEDTSALATLLREEGKYGGDAVCEHPVFRLWASKMHSLAGLGLSDTDRYGKAFEECQRLAQG